MKYNRPKVVGQTMRYIRTKDGQIVDIGHLPLYKSDEPYAGEGIGIWEGRVPIIKEAETIEELCDEYVLESKDRSTRTLLVKAYAYDGKNSLFDSFTKDVKSGWLSYCHNYLQEGCAIYGAIWANDGLKYVAKMNKKGEFELL